MLSRYELARGGIDLTTPRGFAHLLRHRELWPRGFPEWDYSNCYTCAMALLFRALDFEPCVDPKRTVADVVRAAAKILDLDFDTAWNVFIEIHFEGETTTPGMVAQALEDCAPQHLQHARRQTKRRELLACG